MMKSPPKEQVPQVPKESIRVTRKDLEEESNGDVPVQGHYLHYLCKSKKLACILGHVNSF